MLQRFQNFRMGALTAARLNRIIDAVESLRREVRSGGALGSVARPTIIARISGDATVTAEGCSDPRMCVYPFVEVFVRIAPDGEVTAGTCSSAEPQDGLLSSAVGAVLVEFGGTPSFGKGDVVVAAHATHALDRRENTQQMVYVIASGGKGADGTMRLARITAVQGGAQYEGTILGSDPEEVVEFVNLYEQEQHYGATAADIECATITPRRLEVDRTVWVQEVKGSGEPGSPYTESVWVTMTPVAFDSECTCGPVGPGAGAQFATEIPGVTADSAAASLVMQRVMPPV